MFWKKYTCESTRGPPWVIRVSVLLRSLWWVNDGNSSSAAALLIQKQGWIKPQGRFRDSRPDPRRTVSALCVCVCGRENEKDLAGAPFSGAWLTRSSFHRQIEQLGQRSRFWEEKSSSLPTNREYRWLLTSLTILSMNTAWTDPASADILYSSFSLASVSFWWLNNRSFQVSGERKRTWKIKKSDRRPNTDRTINSTQSICLK